MDPLRAFIERLLMFDVTSVLMKRLLKKFNSVMQRCFKQELPKLSFPTKRMFHLISFQQNTILVNQSCSIILHDVLPSGRILVLLTKNLCNMEHQQSNELMHHYWVAESDGSMLDSIFSLPELPQSLDIAGRRRWSTQQTHHELQMLYNRTKAGSRDNSSLLDRSSHQRFLLSPFLNTGLNETPRTIA